VARGGAALPCEEIAAMGEAGWGVASGFSRARLCSRRGEAASLAYKRAVVRGSKEEAALAGGRDGKGEAQNGS